MLQISIFHNPQELAADDAIDYNLFDHKEIINNIMKK